MKDLGKAAFILGTKIYRDRSKRLIGLSESACMDKILNRYKMDNSKRGNIPEQERLDLSKTHGASIPEKNPGDLHWTAVNTILKYLRNTKDMFLVYYGNLEAELRVNCYCDAEFETDRDDIKSQTGYETICMDPSEATEMEEKTQEIDTGDRFSQLPDSVAHNILVLLLNAHPKDLIQMSVLSKT
nr:hypothetical protein [Tanacetum cinerariifolium]